MLYTNVWLTLITVVMFPIMTKAAAAIGSRSRKFFGAQQTAIGAMNGYIQETVVRVKKSSKSSIMKR